MRVIDSGGDLHGREKDWTEWKKRQTHTWRRRVAAMRYPGEGYVCVLVRYLHMPVALHPHLWLMANRCKEPVDCKDLPSIKYGPKRS